MHLDTSILFQIDAQSLLKSPKIPISVGNAGLLICVYDTASLLYRHTVYNIYESSVLLLDNSHYSAPGVVNHF